MYWILFCTIWTVIFLTLYQILSKTTFEIWFFEFLIWDKWFEFLVLHSTLGLFYNIFSYISVQSRKKHHKIVTVCDLRVPDSIYCATRLIWFNNNINLINEMSSGVSIPNRVKGLVLIRKFYQGTFLPGRLFYLFVMWNSSDGLPNLAVQLIMLNTKSRKASFPPDTRVILTMMSNSMRLWEEFTNVFVFNGSTWNPWWISTPSSL